MIVDLDHQATLQTAQESERLASNKEYKTLTAVVDVTDVAAVEGMVAAAVETFGRIDYLVNSAGIGVKEHLTIDQVDLAEMNRFWQINIIGTVNCIKAVTKVMKTQSIATFTSRGSSRDVGRGVILNLGSANSYMATPHVSPYVTTKHAVIGLTKGSGEFSSFDTKVCRGNPLLNILCVALDLAPYQIRVNAICPGWTRTPMVEDAMKGNPDLSAMVNSAVPMRRLALPEEIADVVIFMTSPRSSFVTGVGWIVDGGLTLSVQT